MRREQFTHARLQFRIVATRLGHEGRALTRRALQRRVERRLRASRALRRKRGRRGGGGRTGDEGGRGGGCGGVMGVFILTSHAPSGDGKGHAQRIILPGIFAALDDVERATRAHRPSAASPFGAGGPTRKMSEGIGGTGPRVERQARLAVESMLLSARITAGSSAHPFPQR